MKKEEYEVRLTQLENKIDVLRNFLLDMMHETEHKCKTMCVANAEQIRAFQQKSKSNSHIYEDN